MKHFRKDSAEQYRCHGTALLGAMVDFEQVEDGSFIEDSASYVNNLVGTPHL